MQLIISAAIALAAVSYTGAMPGIVKKEIVRKINPADISGISIGLKAKQKLGVLSLMNTIEGRHSGDVFLLDESLFPEYSDYLFCVPHYNVKDANAGGLAVSNGDVFKSGARLQSAVFLLDTSRPKQHQVGAIARATLNRLDAELNAIHTGQGSIENIAFARKTLGKIFGLALKGYNNDIVARAADVRGAMQEIHIELHDLDLDSWVIGSLEFDKINTANEISEFTKERFLKLRSFRHRRLIQRLEALAQVNRELKKLGLNLIQ